MGGHIYVSVDANKTAECHEEVEKQICRTLMVDIQHFGQVDRAIIVPLDLDAIIPH
jgi:nitrate reductase cytochrome c-type subunit